MNLQALTHRFLESSASTTVKFHHHPKIAIGKLPIKGNFPIHKPSSKCLFNKNDQMPILNSLQLLEHLHLRYGSARQSELIFHL